MHRLYSLLLYLLLPVVILRLLYRSLRAPAYRRRWKERFAWGLPELPEGTVWLHAVSVGEVQAAAPLIRALQRRWPECPLLVTTTTPTGSERVRSLFAGGVHHSYLPYDLPGAVGRFLRRSRPALGLILETELWPNLYRQARRRGVSLWLVNARLSSGSRQRYGRFPTLTGQTLACLEGILAQTEADAHRFLQLGAPPEQVEVVGNLKFDVEIPEALRARAGALRRDWGSRPVWVAGSSHAGEEHLVLQALASVRAEYPDVLLVLAPRHPERFGEVAAALRRGAWESVRQSEGKPVTAATAVLLLDGMGELALYYAAADVAFVGGSLVPVGGHNLLEPAALGVPSLLGPWRFNIQEASDALISVGAARLVEGPRALAEGVSAWLRDPEARHAAGARALEVVAAHRGARDRVLARIGPVLSSLT